MKIIIKHFKNGLLVYGKPNILEKLFWILTNKCKFCGGNLETSDFYEHFNCFECGKNQ